MSTPEQLLEELDRYMREEFNKYATSPSDWRRERANNIGNVLCYLHGFSEGRYGLSAETVNAALGRSREGVTP